MERNYFEELFNKYLADQCSPVELDILLAYIELNEHSGFITGLFTRELERANAANEESYEVHRLLERVDNKLFEKIRHVKKVRLWLQMAAAILIFCCSAGFLSYYIYLRGNNGLTKKELISQYGRDIPPGGNRASIVLSNGRIYNLRQDRTGIRVGSKIQYSDGTPLQFSTTGTSTLKTPNGGEYQVTLSDGSKAWLNAASSITYPDKFSGNRREVSVTGEVYFEVAHNPEQPFVVHSKKQTIEVLGTHFNINDYEDQNKVLTTLAEGKVLVHSESNNQSVYLKPGQQSMVSDKSEIDVHSINLNNALAWKQGKFSFEDKPFDQVMKELARWYDLEIVYRTGIPKARFFGGAYRNVNLSIVLELLESAGVEYKLKGKQIIIY